MKSIFTIAALVIMASTSFAATTKKTSTKTAPAATENTNTYSSQHKSNDSINWTAGFGLGTAGSQFHFGVLGHGLVSVSKMEAGEILVGGETGFLFGPGTITSWIIPIMAEGQFNFKGNGKITPYAGLAMGLGIFHSSASVSVTGFGTSGVSSTSTDFAMLAKGGVFFGNEGKYYAELPLGTLGSSFAIFPTVGMKF